MLASADAACGVGLVNERIRSRGNGKSETSTQAAPVAPMSLHEMEKQLIASVLQHAAGNRTRAAGILGISREGLRTKLQRLQILRMLIPDAISPLPCRGRRYFLNPTRSRRALNLGSPRNGSAIGSVGR